MDKREFNTSKPKKSVGENLSKDGGSVENGKGPTLVLLRGLCRSQFHWYDFPEKLSLAFPDAEIRFLDLAGNGARYKEQSPDSVTAMVEDFRKQLNDVDQTIYLIALSLGGMIGLKWLDLYPKELKKVWIINSSISGALPFYQRISLVKLVSILLSGLLSVRNRELAIINGTSQRAAKSTLEKQKILESWVTIQKRFPVSYENFFRQLKAAIKFKISELNYSLEQSAKIIFVNGQEDKLVSPKCTESLSKMLKSKLIMHPEAGHDLSLDEGDWLINQLRATID